MEFLFLIAGLVVLAFACRTVDNRYVVKLGWVSMLAATYAGGYFISGRNHWAGTAALFCWFLLPWVEILGRVRRLRFPLESEIAHRFPPSREVFPNLDELSAEVEKSDFEEVENAGWKWEETDHFMRLFYQKESRIQAAVSLAQQEEFSVSYVTVTSRSKDGQIFTTSNYPFSYTMKFSPKQKVNRYEEAQSFVDLLTAHRAFLEASGVAEADLTELDVENLSNYVESDMQSQIQHNVKVGVLTPSGEGENLFRYSWRGLLYLWFQIVKDMIRV